MLGDLSREVDEAGLGDVAFQLIDHDRRGAEQVVARGTGRPALVVFDFAVPAFEVEREMSGILVFQGKKRSENVHGRAEDDAFQRRAAGMRVNGLIEQKAGTYRLFPKGGGAAGGRCEK